MKSSRWLWRLAGTAGLLSTLMFAAGFVYAMNDLIGPQPSSAQPASTPAAAATPPATVNKEQLQVVAIGDSLTHGLGDETGQQGYVGRVKKLLTAAAGGRTVTVTNNGRDGYKTADLLKFMQEPGLTQLLRDADIVLLTIGGNDLNQFGRVAPGATPGQTAQPEGEINYTEAAKRLPEAAARLDDILTRLHELNPKAQIVYVGLYHPYLQQDPNGEGVKLLQDWNSRAFAIASRFPNMTVVPIYDLFQNGQERYLFIDHFHPNAAGYERIAERVFQVLQ